MIKYIDRLEYIHFLIKTKSTGSPEQLAKKMQVSKRTVYEYLKALEYLGAQIRYNTQLESYIYEISGDFQFRYKKKLECNNTSLL